MINVNFSPVKAVKYPLNSDKISVSPPINNTVMKPSSVPFKGDINFVLINKCAQKLPIDVEFKHISNVLETLGVSELELGNNIELARLLKSAMCRLKRLGFDIPTRIKCDSKYFENNPFIQKHTKNVIDKNHNFINVTVPAYADWDGIHEPTLFFNPKHNWHRGNGIASKINDQRHAIWHETGHYLHMKNHKHNPYAFQILTNTKLDNYQKEIVRKAIGSYGADESIAETIAETFSRLVSGESYNSLHPEIFHIYTKFNGPMPKVKR